MKKFNQTPPGSPQSPRVADDLSKVVLTPVSSPVRPHNSQAIDPKYLTPERPKSGNRSTPPSPGRAFYSPNTAGQKLKDYQQSPTKSPLTLKITNKLPSLSKILERMWGIIFSVDVSASESRKKFNKKFEDFCDKFIGLVTSFYSPGLQRDVNKTHTLHIAKTLEFERRMKKIETGHYAKGYAILGRAVKLINFLDNLSSNIIKKSKELGLDFEQEEDLIDDFCSLRAFVLKNAWLISYELLRLPDLQADLYDKNKESVNKKVDSLDLLNNKKDVEKKVIEDLELLNIFNTADIEQLSDEELSGVTERLRKERIANVYGEDELTSAVEDVRAYADELIALLGMVSEKTKNNKERGSILDKSIWKWLKGKEEEDNLENGEGDLSADLLELSIFTRSPSPILTYNRSTIIWPPGAAEEEKTENTDEDTAEKKSFRKLFNG